MASQTINHSLKINPHFGTLEAIDQMIIESEKHLVLAEVI